MPYKDKEKQRKHHQQYYQLNKERLLKQQAKYRKEHRGEYSEYQQKYREKNKEYHKEYCKKYYQLHKKQLVEYSRKQYKKNRVRNRERQRKYYKLNKEEISKKAKIGYEIYKERIRKYKNKYIKNRHKTDLKFKLKRNISRLMGHSLKNGKGGLHWEKPIGYTLNDLVKRLEKTLPEGMTWQDFLDGKLQIDHIIPVSVFNFDSYDDLDFRRCFALENLQLLKVKDNLKKSNKIIKPFQLNLKV